MKCLASGPSPAKVLIVGEAPGVDEARLGEPFVGQSGQELTRMLHEAGFIRTECRITNVTPHRPPGNRIEAFFPKKTQLRGGEQFVNGRFCSPEILEGLMELKAEIARTKPEVIIALGDTALWALTGESGIVKWRGSMIRHEDSNAWIIPTYHPAAILRMWSWRFIAVQDLRRARGQLTAPVEEPEYDFHVAPTFAETVAVLDMLLARANEPGPLPLGVDIETRAGHIDCIGIAWSKTEALCIPFFTMREAEKHYFELEEELTIILKLRELLRHPLVEVIGQHFLYDTQYFARHWGFYVVPHMDTMIAHAVCFPGIPKSLDFLASLYLPFHRFWKQELKEADVKRDDTQRWLYNCKDSCATLELYPILASNLERLGLTAPYDIEMSLFEPVLFAMLRGIRINTDLRSDMSMVLLDQRAKLEEYFQALSAWDDVQLVKSKTASPWYNSPKQLQKVLYEVLGFPPIRNRKTGSVSADDEALRKIAAREPLMLPFVDRLLAYRSLGVFYSTFVNARLDHDQRIRCSYNIVGTETFRLNSSADVFGFGGNLQNIPTGGPV